MQVKQAKVRAVAEYCDRTSERHFRLNPDLFTVIEDGDGQTLIMRQVFVEPMFEQPFNEDFERWMKDRSMNIDYIMEAVQIEVENQQMVRMLSDRLLAR